MPGRGAARRRSRPSRAMDRFSPTTGATSATVPIVARSVRSRAAAGPPGSSREQQLGDLERDAAAGQATVRVGRSPARCGLTIASAAGMTLGTRWWSVMMTSMPRSLATATSATLVEPQSTVTITLAPPRHGRIDRRERQAMALVEPARDVGLDGHAEPAQRERHDRQPGQPVRIEIAEDEHPFAAVAGRPYALQEPVRIGQQRAGRGGRSSGSANHASTSASVVDAAGREQRREPGRDPPLRRHRGHRRGGRLDGPGRSSGTGVRSRRQDATRGCTADHPAQRVAGLRRPSAGPGGCEPRRAGHAGDRPTAASPRATGSPRRSTSRSRR